MRVKLFRGKRTEALEEEVNNWLATLPGDASVRHTQTAASHQAAANANGAASPVFFVSIWYDPGSAS